MDIFLQLYKDTFDKLMAAQKEIWLLERRLRMIKNGDTTGEPCHVVKVGRDFKVNLN